MCRVDITGSEMKDGTSKLFKHPLGLLKGEATFDVLEYQLPKVLADMFFPQISKLFVPNSLNWRLSHLHSSWEATRRWNILIFLPGGGILENLGFAKRRGPYIMEPQKLPLSLINHIVVQATWEVCGSYTHGGAVRGTARATFRWTYLDFRTIWPIRDCRDYRNCAGWHCHEYDNFYDSGSGSAEENSNKNASVLLESTVGSKK